MNTLDEIKKAVQELPPEEMRTFRRWFEEIDAKLWDDQFEKDVASGKLDEIADRALRDFENSKCKEL